MTTKCIGKVFFKRNNTFTDNIFTLRNPKADTIIKWQNKPQQEGWYAILFSWEERIFADTNYWDGNYWDWTGPILQCAGPFESEDIAKLWARDNSPENY